MDLFVNMFILYKCENLWEFCTYACTANKLAPKTVTKSAVHVCLLTAVSEQISISPFVSLCFLGVAIPGGDVATELPFTAVLSGNKI